MPAFRAVLFDFFGTLTRAVRRGPAHRAIAEVLGCDPTALADVLDRSFYLRATGALGGAEATMRWAGEQAGGRPSGTAARAAARRRVAAVRADTRLRAETLPVLRSLRAADLRTGLVSDCTHELPAFLPRLPVAPLLDVAVYSVQLGRCKPDPEIFLAACRKLDIPPRDCLYVGDGGSQELSGASRTGLTAVRLTAPDLADHLVFNPDVDWTGLTVASLQDVVALATGDRPPVPRQPVPPDRRPAPAPSPATPPDRRAGPAARRATPLDRRAGAPPRPANPLPALATRAGRPAGPPPRTAGRSAAG